MKHYDYMCVRAENSRECKGRYCKFGWRYVPDESERGGRLSFRRAAPALRVDELDALQRRCDAKAEEIDELRGYCRVIGGIMSVMVAAAGYFVMCAGLEMLGGSAPGGGAVCIAGALAAAAAFLAGKGAEAIALRASRGRRMLLSAQLTELLAETEKIGNAS